MKKLVFAEREGFQAETHRSKGPEVGMCPALEELKG